MPKKTSKTKEQSFFSKLWRLILCLAVPLGGGFLISSFTRDAMGQFGDFAQPPLAPPAWLFPVAWTILYFLMGLASFLLYRAWFKGKKADKEIAKSALVIYGIQLVFNFAWTPVFFNLNQYWIALAILIVMWVLEIIVLVKSCKVSKAAFWCLLPYLLWSTFATYLNIGIALLN